jgi:coenzyme F420-reducing hydrogenase delta subunit
MVSYDVKEIRNTMVEIVGTVDSKRTDPLIVAFVCTNRMGIQGVDLPKNCRPFPVHCTSRIDVLDILKAFETGADGVAVVRCGDKNCKYEKIEPRVNARVKRGQELLKALGMEPERIGLLAASSACGEFSEKMKSIGLRTK